MDATSTAAALTGLAGPGSQQAWDLLVERHGAEIWRLIASRLRDAHEAEDAYQEFWLGLPRAAAGFRPADDDPEGRKARSWLMRVAYTTAIDCARRRRPAQALADDLPADEEGAGMRTDRDEEQRRLMDRVQQALDGLPESYRRPLLLHTVGGLSYEDLAADLRCTVNLARVRVHRGLKRLRELLGVEGERLSEQGLAGLLVPPLLLAPPAPPPLPPPAAMAAAASAPAAPAAAAGPLAVLAQAPVALAAGATIAVAATVAAVAIHHAGADMPPTPVIAATALAGALAGASLDDFEREQTQLVSAGDQKIAGSATLVPAPEGTGGGSGKAARLAWPSPHGQWVDFSYVPGRPKLELDEKAAPTATVKVWAEGFPGIRHISFRLRDAKGEIFQWNAPLPEPQRTGWRTLSVPLDWQKNKGSWGDNKDGVLDFPLSLAGYAIEFESVKVPASAIVIDDIALAAAAKAP